MNWIIPGKLMAFASPYSTNELPSGIKVCTAADIVPIFQSLKINHVIRLNRKYYSSHEFLHYGIKHTELYFRDGSVPPDSVRDKFLEIARSPDVIAIHCKAGLGRTFVFLWVVFVFVFYSHYGGIGPLLWY
jgi:cell division cycle 14